MKWDLLTAPTQLLLIPVTTLKDRLFPPTSKTLNRRLGVAVLNNRVTLAEQTLRKGASPDVETDIGASALLVPTLPPDWFQMPAIFCAASKGRMKMTDLLIAAGANINTCNEDGQTALHVAVQRGRPKLVQALLARGADPSIADKNGKTAFDYANDMRLTDVQQQLHNPPEPVAVATPLKSAAGAFNGEALATDAAIEVKGPLQLKKPVADVTP